MTINQATKQLQQQLLSLYECAEATAITNLVIENVVGKIEWTNKKIQDSELSAQQTEQFKNFTTQLLQHKPVQYVLQEAWFYNMKFFVNENVLIPRPETEELVELILLQYQQIKLTKPNNFFVLDIGTGSGCIAIALKNKMNNCQVTSLDVSNKAIEVAKQNSIMQQALVEYICCDFLNETNWIALPQFDFIVSNPPYIAQHECSAMQNNVLSYEPHLALFVANKTPFIFYKKIAKFGLTHLKKDGIIFVEINQAYGKETMQVFNLLGYRCQLKKDMHGNDRIIIASLL